MPAPHVIDELVKRFEDDFAAYTSGACNETQLRREFHVESTRLKKGTAGVDEALLREIESWRDLLGRNIALRNPGLTQQELNAAVARTINRIIFLRICEDRGSEPYGRLQTLLNGGGVYARLVEIFHRADDPCDSGPFHFRQEKDRPTPSDSRTLPVVIDDETMKAIFHGRYCPDSSYAFSALPADILGRVYERLLGTAIRLAAGHQAKAEDRPKVKKAGGVFYTPMHIVDYIVGGTVGKLLAGRSPAQADRLRILDPACGSGSFLIQAYQRLLDWYRDRHVEGGPEKRARGKKPVLYHAAGSEWRLTTAERKRILRNSIFGVDIDPQAVEVTKLSLLLKVLEGESGEALMKHRKFFHERAMPDLSDNIRCGNSLIAPDFYEGTFPDFPGDDDRSRVNVFDWSGEDGFPEIMRAGGFDAVIGNPPWISLSGKFGYEIHSKKELAYLAARFGGNTTMPNMYEYFVAQGLNLVRSAGWFGFIVPDRLGYNAQFVRLRKRMLTETRIASLMYKVPFPGVTADTLVFVLQKSEPSPEWRVPISEFNREAVSCNQRALLRHPTHALEYFENAEVMSLVVAISSCPHVQPLGQVVESTSGFGGKSSLIHKTQTSGREIPTLKGDSIGRYEFRKQYWFDFQRENITGRTTARTKLGAVPKVLIRKTGDKIVATFDDSGIFPEQSLYFLFNNRPGVDFRYLLGILNSRLLTAYYRAKSVTNKKSIAQVKKIDLDQLPIRIIDTSNSADRCTHDRMVASVEEMLALHRMLAAARTDHEQTNLQRRIGAADRRIDRLVYDLYNLTEKEIRLVEKD